MSDKRPILKIPSPHGLKAFSKSTRVDQVEDIRDRSKFMGAGRTIDTGAKTFSKKNKGSKEISFQKKRLAKTFTKNLKIQYLI